MYRNKLKSLKKVGSGLNHCEAYKEADIIFLKLK